MTLRRFITYNPVGDVFTDHGILKPDTGLHKPGLALAGKHHSIFFIGSGDNDLWEINGLSRSYEGYSKRMAMDGQLTNWQACTIKSVPSKPFDHLGC